MAFGISKEELLQWKHLVSQGDIAFLTHYWLHPRFPQYKTVTKVGCSNLHTLIAWGVRYDLKEEWIHHRFDFPHFDLLGEKQVAILRAENMLDHVKRFRLHK